MSQSCLNFRAATRQRQTVSYRQPQFHWLQLSDDDLHQMRLYTWVPTQNASVRDWVGGDGTVQICQFIVNSQLLQIKKVAKKQKKKTPHLLWFPPWTSWWLWYQEAEVCNFKMLCFANIYNDCYFTVCSLNEGRSVSSALGVGSRWPFGSWTFL